jgi:hypothetical protein
MSTAWRKRGSKLKYNVYIHVSFRSSNCTSKNLDYDKVSSWAKNGVSRAVHGRCVCLLVVYGRVVQMMELDERPLQSLVLVLRLSQDFGDDTSTNYPRRR